MTVFRLSDLPDSDRAMSLNEAVAQVENEITDPAALETLSARFAAYGYVEMREYDDPSLVVVDQRVFQVTDGFPRLIRSLLPEGVARVHYEIELESIARFECEAAAIWE